jgi:BNR repeat-like domain
VFGDAGAGGILASRSTDGGLRWSDPVPLITETDPVVEDHHGDSITADPTDKDLVYVVWTHLPAPKAKTAVQGPAFFAHSRDGGATWQRAWQILDPGPNKLTTGHEIVVLPNGALVDGFTLIAVDRADPGQVQASVAVIDSTTQGRSWSRPTIVDRLQTVGTSDPQTGDPVAGGNLLTDLAVDPTSGRLYLVWQDARFNAGRADAVALSSSDDGGHTWSEPVKVNATPTDLPVGDQQVFTPSVAVAADGTVAVSYFDFRRNDAAAPLWTDRWLVRCQPTAKAACTTADAFGGEVRLTDAAFDLRQAPLLVGAGGPEGLFLGDSMGLASAGEDFLALFSQPHDSDPASVFARRIAPSTRH